MRGKKNGYALILTVIVLGSVVLSLSLYFSWLSGVLFRGGNGLHASKQAEYLAETCAEKALQRIWDNSAFVGTETLNDFGGSCSAQVIDLGGENRQIQAVGSVGDSRRKLQVVLDAVNSRVGIVSWREVGDF